MNNKLVFAAIYMYRPNTYEYLIGSIGESQKELAICDYYIGKFH